MVPLQIELFFDLRGHHFFLSRKDGAALATRQLLRIDAQFFEQAFNARADQDIF